MSWAAPDAWLPASVLMDVSGVEQQINLSVPFEFEGYTRLEIVNIS